MKRPQAAIEVLDEAGEDELIVSEQRAGMSESQYMEREREGRKKELNFYLFS